MASITSSSASATVSVAIGVASHAAHSGLSASEAQRRLIESGRNEIRRKEATNAFVLLARQFASPVIWLLLGASAVSLALGELLDAAAIGVIVIVNAAIGFMQEHRAERAVMALRSMTASRARVLRNSHSVVIPASEVVPGDVLTRGMDDHPNATCRPFSAAIPSRALGCHLREHWDVLRHTQIRDQAFGVVALLEKWGANGRAEPSINEQQRRRNRGHM